MPSLAKWLVPFFIHSCQSATFPNKTTINESVQIVKSSTKVVAINAPARLAQLEERLGSQALREAWIIPPLRVSRLGDALHQWVYANKTMTVTALGCSSTAGAGSDNEVYDKYKDQVNATFKFPITKLSLGQKRTFFNTLGDRLSNWTYGPPPTFHNAAHGGTTTFWMSQQMDSLVGDTDVLVWEFTLTDIQFPTWTPSLPTDRGRKKSVDPSVTMELFLKYANELPSKPAVVLVYMWDSPSWPMTLDLWKKHASTVDSFRSLGMDISVLQGGGLAASVCQNHLMMANLSDVKAILFSRTPSGGLDKHPSRWTHDRIADALEFALLNITVAVGDSNAAANDDAAAQLLSHRTVLDRYAPSTTSRQSIIPWPFLARMSSSITSRAPRFGTSNNGAHAIFMTEVEEGSKSSALRTDRKIDEVVPFCSTNTTYRAFFGTPPPGLSWSALQLSFGLPFKTADNDVVVRATSPSHGKRVFIRRRSDPSLWFTSIRVMSSYFDLLPRNVTNASAWSSELDVSVCVDPLRHCTGQDCGTTPSSHQHSSGLGWAVAYAAPTWVVAGKWSG